MLPLLKSGIIRHYNFLLTSENEMLKFGIRSKLMRWNGKYYLRIRHTSKIRALADFLHKGDKHWKDKKSLTVKPIGKFCWHPEKPDAFRDYEVVAGQIKIPHKTTVKMTEQMQREFLDRMAHIVKKVILKLRENRGEPIDPDSLTNAYRAAIQDCSDKEIPIPDELNRNGAIIDAQGRADIPNELAYQDGQYL